MRLIDKPFKPLVLRRDITGEEVNLDKVRSSEEARVQLPSGKLELRWGVGNKASYAKLVPHGRDGWIEQKHASWPGFSFGDFFKTCTTPAD